MSNLLEALAKRVRGLRRAHGWSRAELAQRSGLSVRFLARIESGEGNISILRLEALAAALGTAAQELVRSDSGPSGTVSLVGLRGAGKSTVGPLLAARLGCGFVEIDQRIVETSGLPLDQLFELHGEPYYRRLEREIIQRTLAQATPVVLAAAGGVVNEPTSWRMLRDQTVVVWLRARPEDHWNRVVDQGDRRPMADNPAAMEELRALLRAREALYAEARVTVETSGNDPQRVAETIAARLEQLR